MVDDRTIKISRFSKHREIPVDETVYLEGNFKQVIETGRNRLLVTGVMFLIAFFAISFRLVDISLLGVGEYEQAYDRITADKTIIGRANIIDRNGVILATSLPTASLYADPKDIVDPEEVAKELTKVFPEMNSDELLSKLKSKSHFVWISRNLTPKQQYVVNTLGLPGIMFQRGEQRVYPHGREAAHILGLTDIDGKGIAGVEKSFATSLANDEEALQLSIDIRVQTMLRQELSKAMKEFKALGAAGAVLDVSTGEIISMVSLPDFDPNVRESMRGTAGFNRVTKGVYEMGSTFKLFTTAMALDSGVVDIGDQYDASKPITISQFVIDDYHGQNRLLTVPEILIHSSNIGTAKMAMDVGAKKQKYYLDQLGLLQNSGVELAEVGQPQYPNRWSDISTMTISYGYGVSVSPLQLANAVASLVNGGRRMSVSLLKHQSKEPPVGVRVISEKTSKQMRDLMHLVVTNGTGRNAAVPGYQIGGKTGTAEKQVNGRYDEKSLVSSFVGAFPIDRPRYVLLALLDEPNGTKKTFNNATGGWVAAPIVSQMIWRMASLFGILPSGSLRPKMQLKQKNSKLAYLDNDRLGFMEQYLAPN